MQNNCIWIQNGTSKSRTEWSAILGADFFHPSLSERLKQAGRSMVTPTTAGTVPMRVKLNLCWLEFTNTPLLTWQVPLLNVTGIFLFPLRQDLSHLQNSEQLCNVKEKGLYKMQGKGRVSENKAEWYDSGEYKEMQAWPLLRLQSRAY